MPRANFTVMRIDDFSLSKGRVSFPKHRNKERDFRLFLLCIISLFPLVARSALPPLKGLSLEELMQVEVTSLSGYAEKLSDAPSAIQVIGSREIERSSALSLAETVRLANNLNVAQKNPHDWAISARGFNANVGNKLLVLIDGRSVYTPLFGGVFWNAQDYLLDDVEQIEVISGPGGTLWGANAVNGVINVTTKNARDTQGALFKAGAGTETKLIASRFGGVAAPGIYYRVYGKFHAIDDSVLTDGERASNAWNQGQAGFRVDSHRSGAGNLSLHGDFYCGNLDVQTGGTARLAGGNLVGQWLRNGDNDSETEVMVYVDRNDIAVPFAASPFAPFGYLKDQLCNYDIKVQTSFIAADRHRLSLGGEYRYTYDVVRQPAPNLTFDPPKRELHLPSFFVQDEMTLRDDLSFIVGTKIEYNSYTRFEYEPSARIQWRASSNQMIWGAVSRAVRMPSRFDRDLREPAPPLALITGGEEFRSETVLAYEIGYRAKVSSRLAASVSAFYNDYDFLRSWGNTPPTGLPIVFQNNLDAKSHGLEINTDFQAQSWWRLNTGYNFLRSHVRVKPGSADFQNALDETADPEHQFALRSMMDLPARLTLDAAFRWIDRLKVNAGGRPGAVPAYAELDLRLGWRPWENVEFALIGKNLLHESHPEFGPPGPTREELQRSVLLKTTVMY